ncbi:Hypothetical Protein FCC1311_114102 [Hondaea fermentalgiana]|uniref:Uncharacterized protein n=1 Tax=Hondaea fermentalgiana TaxID=2315210 RepID=A0A2R5GWH7_9STRA|nr:Hypothetical Protein FCC1311_114102 [Hondaea fermentalgiana]|eukprot:GBG35187.1 Hypothetical Protein FCC1311_114102 [Hondaea fermentalgiana]
MDPELLSREEASEICGINAGARQHVNSVVVKTRAMLERECRIPATECDLFLALLGHDSIDMLLRAMTCSMKRDDKKKQVEEWEFYSFLAQILWATGASKMSKEHAFHWLTLLMEAKTEYGRGAILTLSRFNFLQKHLRGFQDEGDATRAAHQDVSDMARQMHPLEKTIADPTLKLFGDKYLRVTIDDRNRGTVSAGNPVNTCRPRKRHRNWAGSDASADAVFRVKLFSILYDRSYNQVTVLTKILEAIKEKIGGDVAGIEVCLNRVREFGNAKHTHIQRFVTILPAEMMQRFRNGFVFETYGRLRRDIAAQVLFYPEPEVQSLGEDFLDSPRFQDASAGSIDTDFGGLESEEEEEEEENEEEEVERRALADSAQGNDSFVESDLNSDEDSTFARDNSVVDLGDEELNEAAMC